MTNNYRLPVHPTCTQAAYLAGLIDGDGCVLVRRRDRSRTKSDRQRGISFILLVKIGGEKLHLRGLHRAWGEIGNIYVHTKDRKRHLAEWTISSNQARRLLETVAPYMLLKKQQAEIALSMPQPITRWGVTPELREEQERCRVAISRRNKRFGRGKVVEYGN